MALLRYALLALLLAGSAAAAPAVGDRAPDFELRGSDGEVYRLRSLLAEVGDGVVVLAWFPKAFTPG